MKKFKNLIWKGSTLGNVHNYPKEIRREIGFELHNVQHNLLPSDWKPMPSIGKGVREIRIHSKSEYRVMYIASFEDAVYVLHAFVKKTQKTAKNDLAIARQRYQEILNWRES